MESLVHAFGLLARSEPELSLDIYGPDADEAAAWRTLPPGSRPATCAWPRTHAGRRRSRRVWRRRSIGVVPTLRDGFTELLLPVKLLECVHMGLPVVTSQLPVVERYFSEREVRFFTPGSAESLAAAIADVYRNPEQALERARRASERLAEIEWSRQRDAYLSLVDELVHV